jgi:hypothetical protein
LNGPLSATTYFANEDAAICAVLLLFLMHYSFNITVRRVKSPLTGDPHGRQLTGAALIPERDFVKPRRSLTSAMLSTSARARNF